MNQISILFLLSFLPHALLQTEDPHLCETYVAVRYTETERTPLKDYGRFKEVFNRLGIQGAMRNVLKTKLNFSRECCPGYERSYQYGLSCQPIQTTTDSTTDTRYDLVETTTMDTITSSFSSLQKPKGFNKWIAISIATLVLAMIIVVTMLSWYYIRRRRILNNNDIHEPGNELEARRGLFSDTLKDM